MKEKKSKKYIEIHYYSAKDFPAINSVVEKDGKKYRVIDNKVCNITTLENLGD